METGGECKRRRRLRYLESGNQSQVPKSTLAHYRAIDSPSSSKQSDVFSQGVPSATEIHVSDNDSHSRVCSSSDITDEERGRASPSAPESTLHDALGSADCSFDELRSASGDEHITGDSETADGSQDAEEDIPEPNAMSEEDFLAAGLRQFGSETLPHSTTTKAEAVALMMSFLSANGLSWKALDDLLKMGNTFFTPAADVFPRSKYLFRKLWRPEAEKVVEYHFYCNVCSDLLSSGDGMDRLLCPTCKKESQEKELKRSGAFFVTMKMHEQLKTLISQTKALLHDSLSRTSSSEPMVIGDITEGQTYCQLRARRILGASDLTLTVNTDGSPVFSSSGASIWPIQFTVNELPVPQRFEHCTLAGLWFGKGHPNMALFLAKFVEGINSMEPVIWEHEGTCHSSRVFVMCFCVDAPARSAVQNCVLFNGYFGCPWCLIKGDYIDGCVRYTNSSDAPERTTDDVLRDMALALEYSMPINGYKGPSPTVQLPHFDLVWGFTVDYMHAVLLGATRQITEELLSSSSSNKRYYIGTPARVEEINRRLKAIKPPHSFTRLPRPLGTRGCWKASEWRHWLLFYCLPCTLDLLPRQYWTHLKQLVEAVHILLGTQLTQLSINRAETLLKLFVSETQRLYGETAMTFNLHQLMHLAEVARRLGPLWDHSAFVFESGNGRLVKQLTGASGVPLQIVERVVMAQQLECFLSSSLLSQHVVSLCREMLGYAKLENFLYAGDVCLLGHPQQLETPQEVKAAFAGEPCPVSCLEYSRLAYKRQIFHSQSYKRATKSDSSVIQTKDNDYFVIAKIISVGGRAFLLCKKVLLMESGEFPPHIKECFVSMVSTLHVLEPHSLKAACLFMTFSNPAASYVCTLPNEIERD